MKEDYTIEQLEKILKEYIDTNETQIYIGEFRLTEALHVICREINQLKEWKQFEQMED
tara:strand:- start:283 stop:456 length:174 start_codon:yes stop_codon:yes gene_type:complete